MKVVEEYLATDGLNGICIDMLMKAVGLRKRISAKTTTSRKVDSSESTLASGNVSRESEARRGAASRAHLPFTSSPELHTSLCHSFYRGGCDC